MKHTQRYTQKTHTKINKILEVSKYGYSKKTRKNTDHKIRPNISERFSTCNTKIRKQEKKHMIVYH